MEKLDRELQKRVWGRVQSREDPILPQPVGDNLKALILLAQENSVAYQHIARQMHQRDRERILLMHRESRQCIACMKGICRLRGESVQEPRLPGANGDIRRNLEKCYRRERQLWAEWERRSTDPEHGMVFSGLAGQARGHCMTILEMLGKIPMNR